MFAYRDRLGESGAAMGKSSQGEVVAFVRRGVRLRVADEGFLGGGLQWILAERYVLRKYCAEGFEEVTDRLVDNYSSARLCLAQRSAARQASQVTQGCSAFLRRNALG